MFSAWTYIKIASVAFTWHALSQCNKTQVRQYCYNKGLQLSQKFKLFRGWDYYIEPLIINQCAVIFVAGNAFIEGLVSDNEDKSQTNQQLDDFHQTIQEEIS